RLGSWATAIGDSAFCRLWPEQPPSTPPVTRPLPDIPVLVVAGGRDTRTPAAGGAAIAARFPHGRFLVVPGIGHSVVLGGDISGCAVRAGVDWMRAARVADCKRPPDVVSPLEAFPKSFDSLGRTGRLPARVGRTLTAVVRTTREAGAIWVTSLFGFAESDGAVAGVYGGRLVPAGDTRFLLDRYSLVPGVQLSGSVSIDTTDWLFPFRFAGTLSVSGPKATSGRIRIDRH